MAKKETPPVVQNDEPAKNEGKLLEGKTDAEARRESLRSYETDQKNYSGRYRPVQNLEWKANETTTTIADGKKLLFYNIQQEKSTSSLDSDYTYKGGFYYDAQLEDPFLSASLHANTKIVNGEWVPWPKSEGYLEPISGSDYSGQYGIQPLARCIISEDFSYSIINNFSDYNAGNPIEDIFTNFKPYAPILGKFGTNLRDAASQTKGNSGSTIVDALSGLGETIGGLMKGASNYLNKALFVQGSRFSYFNGTQFNFNNMEMKFIAFSDYVTTDGVTWEFQSVEDYIKTLQPYVMGIYTPYNADFLKETGISGDVKDFIKQYVGFQDPPGGFEMSTKALDNVMRGTLRLNIGNTWAMENLVIKGMNVNMSRVQAKHPENEGETVPLYAEISIQLAPAAAFVDTAYRKVLEHNGMTELRDGIKKAYSNKLGTLKENLIKDLNINVQET